MNQRGRSLVVFMIAVLVAVPLMLPVVTSAHRNQSPGTVAVKGPSARGRSVNPHTLPAVTGHARARSEVPDRLYASEDSENDDGLAPGLGHLRSQSPARHLLQAAHVARAPAASPAGTTAEFPTLDYNATGQMFNPPDGGLAVGPTSEMVAVNESFALYGRTGSKLLGPISYQSFFGVSNTIFDPRALYDAGNTSSGGFGGGKGRFVLLATTHDNSAGTASYLLAVSQSDTPASSTAGWCTYQLNAVVGTGTSATWPDNPGLGMDGNNLYITSTQYTFDPNSYFGGSFQGSRLLVLPKGSVYPDTTSGACPTATSTDFQNLTNPDGTPSFAPVPADEPDALPGTGTGTMYVVNPMGGSASHLVLRSLTVSPSGTTLNGSTWVPVPAYSPPVLVSQPGGSNMAVGDGRLRTAVYRSGTIYTGQSTQTASLSPSPNASSNIQWYAIDPATSTAVTHDISDPNVSYFKPGVAVGCTTATTPCSSPFVAITFSGAGASQPASAFYELAGGAPVLYQQGVPGYTLTDAWGDYPGVALDPADPTHVWLLTQYAAQTSDWGMALASVSGAPDTATPTSTSAPATTATSTAVPTSTATNTPVPTPAATGTSTPSPVTYRQAVLSDSPSVYYRLDESSGTSAADSSGNGHTGTYTSAALLNQSGATSDGDGAISGSGSLVDYGGGAGLPTGSGARTAECWFKTGTSQPNRVLVSWGSESGTGLFALMTYSATQVKVSNWNDDYLFSLPAGTNAFDGTWHHLAATWNGSSLTAYFDGQSLGTQAATFSTSLNGAGLVIGASTGANDYAYSGAIDEVAIYPTALTATRIQAHYQAASSPANATATPTSPPSPTNTPVPTATMTPLPAATSTSIPVPTNTPVPSPTVTPAPTPTSTAIPTATDVPTSVPSDTPVPTATQAPTNTPVPTPTSTSTLTPTASSTPTAIPTNTPVPTPTQTLTPAPTDTAVPTATGTPVPVAIPTPTNTAVATATETPMPVSSPTQTSTSVPTQTATPSPVTYRQAVLSDRPNIYYRLDESSGTSATDSSGNGHTGAYTSAALLNQSGATSDGDRAISGRGGMVKYTARTGLPTGSGARTVECWFKTGTSQSNRALVSWGSESGTDLFALMVYSGNQVKVSNWVSDYLFTLPAGANAFDGRWHHLAATWDGSALTTYYDGQRLGTRTATFSTALNGAGLVVGASTGANDYAYSGAIDEVAIYPAALTATRIQAHYHSR